MTGELKRFFTVGLCATFSCSSLLGWGQDLRLNRALERKVAAQMTTDQKQMRQALFNTFDYTDIIQALYQLHDAYNNPAITPESFKHLAKKLPFQNALPDTPTQGPQLTDLSLKNDVLEAISQHKLTPEELLNYIDPLTPAQSNFRSWQNTYYASMYLNSVLANTPAPYQGLEQFLRHAQMRVSYRLSSVLPLEKRDHLQTQAIAQLRLNLMVLHITYKRLYGKDPLESVKGPFPFARELQEVVVTGKGRAAKTSASQTAPEMHTDGKSIYELTRSNFHAEITGLKTLLTEADRYSFTKFVEVLKGRNTTKQFSAKQAALNVAGDFFWINSIVDLGKWIFSDEDKTPMANLSALVPAAVEYELLQDNFSNVKQILALLEPEKLAENKYGAIFKNDALYQNMQPAVMEIFNTLYGYASAPGLPASKRQQVLNLLGDFANPNQYSIMTRLAALSVAAKLVSLRQDATNPYPPANTPIDNSWAQVKLRGENPLPALGQNKAQQLYAKLQQGPAFADQMAQYIVDIYGTLTAHNTLAGLHDYGLNATQMQQLADELARLYNIFAKETKGRYPQILAQGNVEEVWVNEGGLRVKKLHYFGARVKNSQGQTVEMFTHIAPNSGKYEKDTQDMVADLAVAVCSWKAMVGIYRFGKKGVQAAIRLTLPKAATAQIIPIGTALGKGSGKLTLQTALKAGVQTDAATVARLQYVLNNPIPEITTRAELVKFLGLSETASDKAIKQALRKLSIKYHPDRLAAITSTRGAQYVSDQMAALNNLKDVMEGKGLFSAVAEQQAKAAQEQARAAQAAEFETKSRFGKMADAAAEEAAKQTRYRAPDAHSWGRVAAAFAGWNVLDYGLSFINTPVEETMAKDAQKEAEKRSASTKDMPEMANQPSSTEFLSNLSTREVKESDGTVRRVPYIDGEGSMFRLPVNLIRLAYLKTGASSYLGMDDVAQLQAGHMNLAYAKAQKQGTITGFKEYIDKNLEDLQKNKADNLKYNEPYLAALKTGKKELKTAYQIYAQDLKRARTLADEDVEKASEQFMQSTQKFADVQADILVRGVKAYSAQQLPQSLAVQAFNLQWLYPNVVTEQDIAQVNALQTQLVRANDEMLIKFFTALPKSLRTGQDAAALQKAALNRFAQQKAQLQAQVTQIQDRLYKAQHKINLENQWVETMSDMKEQLNEDMVNMYPLGIEDYPEVKEKIDVLFDTYLEEVYGLLITAQQNEEEQTLSEDENYQAFSYGVTRARAKRNTAFAAIKRDLRAQGIKLFNQRPARVQVEQTPADSEYDY